MNWSLRTLWSHFLRVALPFFRRGPRGRAGALLATLVFLLLSVNGLNVVNSYVGRDFMSALAERRVGLFYQLALVLAGVFAAATLVEVFTRYTEQRLALFWRQWLTEHLVDRYLSNRAYRRLATHEEIDNPDQRITEDVKTFTATTLSFLILVLNALITLLAFIGVLWSITPWLVLAAVVYAGMGSLGTVLLGRRLVGLNNLQLRKEADFRFILGRVREHADSIAQLKGEADEKKRLGTRLQTLVDNFLGIITVNRNLGFFITGYNYLTQIIPAAVVAPLYFSGQVEFGTVTQAAMAFTQVLGAFSLIVTQFQQITAYAAVVNRLGSLWELIESGPALLENGDKKGGGLPPVPLRLPPPAPAVKESPAAEPAPGPGPAEPAVLYQHLTVRTPRSRQLLIENLCFEVARGKRVVVTGPHGSGKTALLLATVGLWQDLEGQVTCPRQDVMLLPERPYLIPGRLKDLTLYGVDGENLRDERILGVLEQVGLEGLVRQPEGLNSEGNWAHVLSAGEQQTLGIARILLANPCFAFLDGISANLESLQLERLYRALASTSITYVSVSGHPALLAYHDLRLDLAGNGHWQIGPAGSPHNT